ncbi:MAG: tRNA pseudouridine(13) synthase TruD [Candidatus Thorarchaeota archaeon]
MIDPPSLELAVGMELYSTTVPGVGGRLKKRFEDFLVEEITPEGKVLEFKDWEGEPSEMAVAGEHSKYVSFVIQKMGLSTLDASTILAAELKLPQHLVTYAGLKDKRAVTVQMMSIPASAVERLREARLSRMTIRNLFHTRHRTQIGDLWGNRFTVRLSEMDAECAVALDLAKQLKQRPLLNYFGVQRFGVTRPFTHLVGKALVKRNYEEAARLLLTVTSEYEAEQLTEARKRLAIDLSPDDRILEAFPRDLSYERIVMKQLIKHPGDFRRAFSRVPSRILTILVHSYQSYLFNRLITLRAKSGIPIDRPEPGDFLIKLDETHSGRDLWLYVTDQNLEERTELVHSGEYSLAAPLPGYSTKTPKSRQSELLHKLLKDEDIGLPEFRNPEWKALDAPGGLHLLAIALSQIESRCAEQDLVLEFRLMKGSYATVVMRELMKNHPINRV